VKRLEPGFEDRQDLFVALGADAAEASGTGVVVEIRRKLEIFRLRLHGFAVGEMLLDVSRRTQQPLLLAAPQRHPHRPIHFQMQRPQNAHHFHRHRGTSRVVGGPRAVMPGVEVPAHHHHLVFPGINGKLRITRKLRDDVERIRIAGVESGLDVKL